MLYVTYTLNALLMVGMPLLLGLFLARRFGLRWGLFGAGAATFVASQVLLHIPLNLALLALFERTLYPGLPDGWRLPFDAVVFGLTAGVSEEGARYVAYRRFLRTARTWEQGVMFGAGHGGVEAILLGVLAGIGLFSMALLRQVDPAALGVPAEQLPAVRDQLAAFWSAPWYATLLGAVERVLALSIHLTLAVMVLQVFTRGSHAWLAAAIGWHAVVDALAIFGLRTWGIYGTEAVVGVCAAVSLGILFALRPRQAAAETPPGSSSSSNSPSPEP
jgi:uncharacterized membrane protein YhfC